MNYRHSYHSGNFADVLKHFVLTLLIEKLTEKERPITFLDTHAGAGLYDLGSPESVRSREAAGGIQRILRRKDVPASFVRYLEAVRAENAPAGKDTKRGIAHYPGSPLLAARLLRPADRLVLVEQLPEIHQSLRELLSGDARVTIHCRDAYESLGALLPPALPRGLALIDPPYEDPDEFGKLERSLSRALGRWQQGVFCLWYPVKDRVSVERFEKTLARQAKDTLAVRLAIDAINPTGPLRACGLLILRAPWGVEEHLAATLPWLQDALSDSPARQLSVRKLS